MGRRRNLRSRSRLSSELYDLPELASRLSLNDCSVWKVLRGPNRDWPLAICDFTTLDLERDIELCDVVERDCVRETISLYHNSDQRWYFIDNQEVDEALLFRNCHSTSLDVPCMWIVPVNRSRQSSCAHLNVSSANNYQLPLTPLSITCQTSLRLQDRVSRYA